MEPNQDSNKENMGSPSPSFIKNMGRLAHLPPDRLREIARRGGLAKSEKKRLSSQINPIKTGKATTIFNITRCDECSINKECSFYSSNSACYIELNIRRSVVRQFKAFIGDKPEDMLVEIMKQCQKLEKMIEEDPTHYKLLQEIHLLISIYKMKFGDNSFVRQVNVNASNPSVDIKRIMGEIRK